MYATDPISARQMRSVDLVDAAEAQSHDGYELPRVGSGRLRRRVGVLTGAVGHRLRRPRSATSGLLSGSHELFRSLDQQQLEALGQHLDVRAIYAGESLGVQGERAETFVIVLDGRIGVTIGGVPQSVLDDGSHFGSLPLLEPRNNQHRASFAVLAPGHIAEARPQQFREILDGFPSVATRIYAMAAARRDYLTKLAACEGSQRLSSSTLELLQYPVHLSV
jgi:CRP-like cAMP-binding protein